MTHIQLVFPHQLFEAHLNADKNTTFIFIEDDLFFRQFKFHKQKLTLHRASMQEFKDRLEKNGYSTHYIETSSQKKSDINLQAELKKLKPTSLLYYELSDDFLTQNLEKIIDKLQLDTERLPSPGFLTNLGQIDDYFESGPNRMQSFYEWQRKRLNILVDKNNKPTGGKWSFDEANRKKLPKNIDLPNKYETATSDAVEAAKDWTEKHFGANYGELDNFRWPTTHAAAKKWLDHFIQNRLSTFGPYEDAIDSKEDEVFHSLLSPLLNIGLLTPKQVLSAVMKYHEKNEVPIESLEGFIRQLIGWREYMRATYLRYSRKMRTENHLNFSNTLKKGWWDGSLGLTPADTVIARVVASGYAHHIERLMILGNLMVLLRIDPDEVYEWFMTLFIDAYDWVMVPNVYAMSQFAAGDKITTKPYVSGSNYIIKMSDYKKDEWAEDWDGLYWTFVNDYREVFEKNYRAGMVLNVYDKFDASKKKKLTESTKKWLSK